MNCPICLSPQSRWRYELYDDRYGYPESFSLYACSTCGHCYLNVAMSAEETVDLYTRYYPRAKLSVADHRVPEEKSPLSLWFDGLKASAYRNIPRNVRVLDIGCGFGQSLGYHKARGCDVYGVEADANISRIAQEFGYKVHVGIFDPSIYPNDYFDYVSMDQVLEHIPNPHVTFSGIKRILKPGGRIIVSTPNANGWGAHAFGHYWINWHTPYHVNLYTKQSLQILSETSGLTLKKITTTTNSDWLHYQWMHLAHYPNKGCPSRFWQLQAPNTTTLTKILSLAYKYKLNHLITRTFDLARLGDNLLAVIEK